MDNSNIDEIYDELKPLFGLDRDSNDYRYKLYLKGLYLLYTNKDYKRGTKSDKLDINKSNTQIIVDNVPSNHAAIVTRIQKEVLNLINQDIISGTLTPKAPILGYDAGTNAFLDFNNAINYIISLNNDALYNKYREHIMDELFKDINIQNIREYQESTELFLNTKLDIFFDRYYKNSTESDSSEEINKTEWSSFYNDFIKRLKRNDSLIIKLIKRYSGLYKIYSKEDFIVNIIKAHIFIYKEVSSATSTTIQGQKISRTDNSILFPISGATGVAPGVPATGVPATGASGVPATGVPATGVAPSAGQPGGAVGYATITSDNYTLSATKNYDDITNFSRNWGGATNYSYVNELNKPIAYFINMNFVHNNSEQHKHIDGINYDLLNGFNPFHSIGHLYYYRDQTSQNIGLSVVLKEREFKIQNIFYLLIDTKTFDPTSRLSTVKDFSFKINKFFIKNVLASPSTIEDTTNEPRDSFFDKFDKDNIGDNPDYYTYEKDDNGLFIMKDGQKIYTKDSIKESNCANTYTINDTFKCTNYLQDCLQNGNITNCKTYLMEKDFWTNVTTEIKEITPEIAMKTLNTFKFNTKPNNGITEYETLNDWYSRLKEIDSTLTYVEITKIKENNKLGFYLNGLINKINKNPIILNPNYQSKNVNKSTSLQNKYGLYKRTFSINPDNIQMTQFLDFLMKQKNNVVSMVNSSGIRFNNGILNFRGNNITSIADFLKIRPFAFPIGQIGGSNNLDVTNITKQASYFRIIFEKIKDLLNVKGKTMAPDTIFQIDKYIKSYEKAENILYESFRYIDKYLQIIYDYKDLDKDNVLSLEHISSFVTARDTALSKIDTKHKFIYDILTDIITKTVETPIKEAVTAMKNKP
jgi:hypothetical protein